MKPQLTYVSLFSGIEACSVAMSRIAEIDWKPIFFSEIEDFPCRVLKYHFPDVPNLGDVTKIRVEESTDPETNTKEKVITNGHTSIPFPGAGIDILAGGSPCQGFSVAGKRLGLDDPRSCLAMHYARLVEELHPRILFYENVPGMLSSAAAGGPGLDFYAFLRTLVNLGYDDISYRVFDAQYVTVDGFPRAVPQRRKRVFVVGLRSVGRAGTDVPASAEILFERASLLGDTPPRREAGQGFAEPPGYRIAGDDRLVEDAAGFGETGRGYWQPGAQCLRAEGESRPSRPGNIAVVGGDAGRSDGRVQHSEGQGARASGTVGGESLGGGVAPTLISSDYKGPGNTQDGKMIIAPVVMDKEAYNSGKNQTGGLGIQEDNRTSSLRATGHAPAVALSASFDGTDCSPTLHRPNGGPGASDQEIFSQGGHTSPARS